MVISDLYKKLTEGETQVFEFILDRKDAFNASESLDKNEMDTFIASDTDPKKSILRVRTDNDLRIGLIVHILKSYIKDLSTSNIKSYKVNSNTFFKK